MTYVETMIGSKRIGKNGPPIAGGPSTTISWDDEEANEQIHAGAEVHNIKWWVGKGPLNQHCCAKPVHVPEILSSQTSQKLTKCTDTVCDQKSTSDERERDETKKKVNQRL